MPEAKRAPQASKKLLVARNLVLEMIVSGASLDRVFRALVAFIEQQVPAARCVIFLADPDGHSLRLAASSKLPRSFTRLMDRGPIGPHAAPSGQAAYRRERVIVPDVTADPLYPRQLFQEYDLRSCWATPIVSEAGAVLGVVSIYRTQIHVPGKAEIAAVEEAARLAGAALERLRGETGSKAGYEDFRALIENTSDVISVLDLNGVIRYLSPSVLRILGFHPGELIGTSGFDCFHPDDLARARWAFEQALRQPGVCRPIEQRFRHKNGSWRTLDTVANNQIETPTIRGVIVTGHDITDRKRTEQELISSQDRYRELFENANEIVYTHDLSGRLTSLNKAGEQITGYSRAEAIGMNISEFIAPEYRLLWREMLDRKIGGEAKTIDELEILDKSGARISLEVSTRLIFQQGKPVAAQGIARDVTERRRLESQLSQSHKMQAIGRLAGGIAHDFNNMLTVITGFTQWILDELPPDSPMYERTSEILLASNRAAALTNQLLVFSRNQVLQPVIVDLNSLVEQMEQMLRRLIGEDIELVTETSSGLGLIRADPGQIEQVILNLAVNARDAMPRGGSLILETANIRIGEEDAQTQPDCPPGAYVMLSVSDSGIGIDQETQAHIFEPFFTTKAQGRGKGLGISTVYGIVKQVGGHIRVESEPGAGAVFGIYFPRVTGRPEQKAVPRPLRRVGGVETILLVEDEASLRKIVGGMLQRLGYTILEAPGGRAAQALVAEYDKPIALLLTDVVMPELGGRELARRLKTVRPDLKVLFMSGYADDAIVQQGVLESGAAYLQKPFTPDALASKVREVLDG